METEGSRRWFCRAGLLAFASADEAEKEDDEGEEAVEDSGDETVGDSEFVDLITLFPDYPDKSELTLQMSRL